MLKRCKPSLDWLLLFLPVALILHYGPGFHYDAAVFVCTGLAIVPLAGLMGRATEHLAEHMGPGAGGLLNATFGNAAEFIIAIMALKKGLIGVVKASITGSIIGNILLVLGLSVLAGGMKFSHQHFNRAAIQTTTTSLLLASVGLLIPTVFHYAAAAHPGGWSPQLEQQLSTAIAVVLLGTYLCTLFFFLFTHKQLFSGPSEAKAEKPNSDKSWSIGKSLLILALATALVAWLSEMLVGTVEAARLKLGVTELFIGVIVVAIIGNAAEHSTAVWMARRNKIDLSLNIAIGSSLQIALFVAPLLVFVSYFFGAPMNLEFSIPEVVAVIIAVHLAAEISNDGETNWMEGVQLLSVYLILAILFYFLPSTH